jgi:hypothetical protein
MKKFRSLDHKRVSPWGSGSPWGSASSPQGKGLGATACETRRWPGPFYREASTERKGVGAAVSVLKKVFAIRGSVLHCISLGSYLGPPTNG